MPLLLFLLSFVTVLSINFAYCCRVMICSLSPKDLGYEPNTMNLERIGERARLLVNESTASKDLKNEQTQKNTDET